MRQVDFVHLRIHSAYSLLEGALPFDKLLDLTKRDRMPAVAVTDSGNLFGALEFSEKAASKGIQALIGCQLAVDFASIIDQFEEGKKAIGDIVLLAMNQAGFANLSRLVSFSFIENDSVSKTHVTFEKLKNHSEGLICLSGGHEGALNNLIAQQNLQGADATLNALHHLFKDRFYIELQRHGLPEQAKAEKHLVEYAYANSVPIVATNNAYFPHREDYEAHDTLLAIAEGRMVAEDDRRRLTAEHYFKRQDEMCKVFSDLPEALGNTLEIAARCSFRPTKIEPILPSFAAQGDQSSTRTEAEELRAQSETGLKTRLANHGTAEGVEEEVYLKRLDYELSVIEQMKFPGYFLIVADFVQWAKANDIPVGPGRGSGAGSLVAWSLTITDIDPLKFSLLFERFLNPDRISMPDFDIDFCQDKRDQVIRYVQSRYGVGQVAQIITFGTLQARAVLRDVGRVLQMPYGQVDRICKMVPSTPANPMTLKEAIASETRLKEAAEEEDVVKRLFSIATKLEGLYRHASTHAAGIVIGDRPLEELVPLYRDPRSDMPVTQYNMKWVEQAGLVKFDFLGLKTLTIIQKAIELLAKRGVQIDIDAIPLDDLPTYEMLSRSETVGVFQLESQGMRRALAGMKPDRFEDIIALVALYRPGPMENIPTYNRRKHGQEEPEYLHDKLKGILEETYGVIIYQEQVLQIGQVLSGYSLGEADLLRRAMGKKIKSEMDIQRGRFVEGAVERDVDRDRATEIFDKVAKFADYGFNKSHAAAYALVAYQTGYLKANYPVEFLAAVMSLDKGNTDKLSDYCGEAKRLKIKIELPCVSKSSVDFDVEDGRILYALGALKGVGQNVIEAISEARKEQPFDSISDFAVRTEGKGLNKRTLQALTNVGAFDCLITEREKVSVSIDRIMAYGQRVGQNARLGQNELFGGAGASKETVELLDAAPWKTSVRLNQEYRVLGFYLSAHPLDEYKSLLEAESIQTWEMLLEAARDGQGGGQIAATILNKQERRTKKGNRMGILVLSDPTGQFEATLFSEKLSEFRELLEPGLSYIFTVGAEYDDETEEVRVRIHNLEPLDDLAYSGLKKLQIYAKDPSSFNAIASQIEQNMTMTSNGNSNKKNRGGSIELILMLDNSHKEVVLELDGPFLLSPEVAGSIKSLAGVVDVKLDA